MINNTTFKFLLLEGNAKDSLKSIPDCSIHCGVTSPPYWEQRDYGVKDQLGKERTPQEYVDHLVDVFKEIKRVLRNDATFWLNIGDGYCKKKIDEQYLKQKDLIGVPWMVAFALRKDGWFLRSDIIWQKVNPMPESINDRPSKSYEHLFLLSKKNRYFYDAESIKEFQKEISIRRAFSVNHVESRKDFGNPNYAISGEAQDKTYKKMRKEIAEGKVMKCNKRDVWRIPTSSRHTSHFAVFPEDLVKPCVKAGTSEAGCCSKCHKQLKRVNITGDIHKDWAFSCKCDVESVPSVVLDPFNGSGTTGMVCSSLRRNYVGIELSPTYFKQTKKALRMIEPCWNSEVFSFEELLSKENSNA